LGDIQLAVASAVIPKYPELMMDTIWYGTVWTMARLKMIYGGFMEDLWKIYDDL